MEAEQVTTHFTRCCAHTYLCIRICVCVHACEQCTKIGNIQWWNVNEIENVHTGIEDGHTVHTNFTLISTKSNGALAAPILTHSTIEAGGHTCRAGQGGQSHEHT